MKRGRKGDKPKVKAAKAGHFRKADTRKRAKAPKMSVEQRAQLLSGLGEGEVPVFLLDETLDFALELQIWKDQAPDLRKINALARLDRYSLAMYCVHMADWIRAVQDIRANGATYKARNTINKDVLHKLNPMVRVRDMAEKHIMELGARFGLDPASRFRLVGIQSGLAGQGLLPGLDGEDADESKRAEQGPTGILSRNATPPPRPN